MPTTKTNENGLTPREQQFAELYLTCFDAPKAYIEAGFKARTTNAIKVNASRLLAKAQVQEVIQTRMKEATAKIHVTQESIITAMARIGLGDVRSLYAADGSLKHPKDMTADEAALIAGIEVRDIYGTVKNEKGKKERVIVGVERKYKLANRIEPLRLLGVNMGMFAQKVVHDGVLGLVDAAEMTPERKAQIAKEMMATYGGQ